MISKHARRSETFFYLCVEYLCLLCFTYSATCLLPDRLDFPEAVAFEKKKKAFSQAVSVQSHACQTAAFDFDFITWEYLQYVDLCVSWDCHFITSFSRHIESSLFPSLRQSKSGPMPGRHTMETAL